MNSEDTPQLNDEAREFFRVKGREGGRSRAKNLTPAQRSEIARKGGKARGRNARRAKAKKA